MSARTGRGVYRLLLRLLPSDFRGANGAEMEALFKETVLSARRRGRGAWLLAWIRGAWDVVALALRRRRPSGRPQSAIGIGVPLRSEWIRDAAKDVRFALRGLARSRAFALVAVLSLALGIGINAAVFTVVHGTWMAPIPGVNEVDGVVELMLAGSGHDSESWSYPDFHSVREADTPIEAVAGWKDREGMLTVDGVGQRVRVMHVSANYFRVLGVVPSRGRDFLVSEDAGPGQHPVAVLSHDLWQNRLEGDPDIIGRTITLNRTPYAVVGVASEPFRGHRPLSRGTDLWVPLMQDPWVAGANSLVEERGMLWLRVLGRLSPGATVDEANAALEILFGRLARDFPETNEQRWARAHAFGPVPAHARGENLAAVALLFVLLGLVLLIICGNVAGMVLARSVTREREIAIRMALGSGQGRVVRLFMAEAGLLALAAGGLGFVLAVWATSAVPAVFTDVRDISFGPSGAVVIYSLLLTLATTCVFGLAPALRFSRPGLLSSLKDDSGGGGRRVGRVHRLATSAQTGVALILLIVCNLFLRALGVANQRDLGFEPHNLLTSRIDLEQVGYQSWEEASGFLDRMTESIGSLPGVASVSIADGFPLDLVGNFSSASRSDRPGEESARVRVEFTQATEGYFETIGTPLLRGRGFGPTDHGASEPVAVITQTLAGLLWPGEEAVGQRMRFSASGDHTTYTVVGVVGPMASSVATRDLPHVFVSLRQSFYPRINVLVRGRGDAATLARSIQSAVLAVDPGLPMPLVVTSGSLVRQSTEGQRLWARAAGALGLLALLLSAIGVYGVGAFAVTSRTREIGVRMAMGATRERVLRSVLGDAVRLAVPGLVVGGLLAVGTGAAMRSFLFGLSPVDPVSLGAAAGVLFLVVLVASLVPARRAARIDPMEALRSE